MRALSNRILDALRAEGPMTPDDIAIVLGEPVEAIRRTLARLPPGAAGEIGGVWGASASAEPAPAPPTTRRRAEHGSIVGAVRASLRDHGPQTTAQLAERLGIEVKRISSAATAARDIIGDRQGSIYLWRLAEPGEAPKPIADPLRWVPCPSYPRISEACYRGGLVVGGLTADHDIWSAEDESEALANLGDLHERVRWWVGAEGGAGHDRPATGYAPDAAAGRRAVEACAEAIGFVGVGADGAVWGGA